MKKLVYLSIGAIEIVIGISTLIFLIVSRIGIFPDIPMKPTNVYIFVLVSAIASFCLGTGLVLFKEWARALLVFFSGYIIMQKLLLFAGLLHFNGEMTSVVPTDVKNILSLCYHFAILVLLVVYKRKDVKI